MSQFRFAPSGVGTEVTATFGGRPTSRVARVLGVLTAPLARRAIGKALGRDLEDIATAAERT